MTVRRHFINLNPVSPKNLPQAMAVIVQKDIYYAHLLHAEVDHYNKPQVRRIEPHAHDCYHLVLVTGGKGRFFIEGTTYTVRPGQIFLTGPGQVHQFLNFGSDSTRYAEVTFELLDARGKSLRLRFEEMLSLWTNQPCDFFPSAVLPSASVRFLEGKLERLIEIGQRQSTDLELNLHLADFLTHIFLAAFRQIAPTNPQPLDALRSYIRTHYQEKLSLSELAARVHLTPNYLSRHFKELYRQTPIDYQIDLRLCSACDLLKTVNDPLDQIAHQVGFEDVYYFSRLFRRRIGQSPGRYRLSGSFTGSRRSKAG